jgi:thiamine pyrophosphate-dependent acetolactate synthase large subunit-like protein
VLAAECELPDDEFAIAPASYRFAGALRASPADIVAAAALLRDARRPLIVAGGGVIVSRAEESLRRLAERLRAPVVPTQMALGVIPTDSPHFIGHGGIIGGDAVPQAFAQADLIVAIGCRFSSWMWDELGPLVRRHHRVININIDPAALGAPIHSVALQADAGLALADILDQLDSSTNLVVDGEWLTRLRKARAAYEQKLLDLAGEGSPVMHPAALARAIAAALPDNAIAVYDGGHTTFWSNDFTPVHSTRTRFHDPGMAQLGFGLPYALSLQLQHPDKPVFNITGDGAFGFTLQELDTARRYGLPVVNLIHNNAAWGVIRAGQEAQFGFELGTSLADTDYAAIARGFGCFGETAKQAADIGPALKRALASRLPAVIDCHTRFVPHPSMSMFGRMNRYGFEALTSRSAAAGAVSKA